MNAKHAGWMPAAVVGLVLVGCGGAGQKSHEEPAAGPKAREVAPAAEAPHWSYEGEAGPDRWSALSPDWAPCGGGQSQSPIDIHETLRAGLPAMAAGFKPAQLKTIHHAHMAAAINNGHTIQVNYTEGDVLTLGEEPFQLLQYHFHSPSEHTVGGRHYPMEMHMVHKSAGGTLAVIGVFIAEGQHNAAFDPIWSNLPKARGVENHFENVTVDVGSLLPSVRTTYRYRGSLTTPPCSEGVQWIVMTSPIHLSAEQIGAFQSIIQGNNRPVQPLNGRAVATDMLAGGGTK
jgi:carbonic anhydrase